MELLVQLHVIRFKKNFDPTSRTIAAEGQFILARQGASFDYFAVANDRRSSRHVQTSFDDATVTKRNAGTGIGT